MSVAPAQILGLEQKGSLSAGSDADITVFNPDQPWTVSTKELHSKSSNTPLDGWTLHGRATHVIVGGQLKKQP